MGDNKPTKNYQQSGGFTDGDLQIAAYMFAGLAMMLNIRLSYSAAPYALLRFKLPENLFSVFVRTTSSALELWCIPSMLLGNIMEQVYNQTQEIPGVHSTGIKNSELKSKAGTLKGTATDQSNIELGHTNQTDLNKDNNYPESKLKDKAGELATKAQELYKVAGKIVTEAANKDSPLKDLSGPAGILKEAAKGSGGLADNSLHAKANELAARARTQTSDAASTQADAVITAFDKVEENYLALMGAYKVILDKLTQTDKDKVTVVVKAYHEVNNTYYQMLIRYRITSQIGEVGGGKILNKAKDLYTNAEALANNLRTDPPDQEPKKTLRELAETLKDATNDTAGLQKALKDLRDAQTDPQIATNALEVIDKYNVVVSAYSKVKEKESEYQTHANNQYTPVKDAFDALEEKFEPIKNSYENVLRLRVQELSNLAQTLNQKANELPSAVSELRDQATQLASVAGSGTGLQQKALLLVGAINSDAGADTQATEVIQKFEAVKQAYEALAEQPTYSEKLESALAKIKQNPSTPLQGAEENVKNVETAYSNLKTLYDKILNITKIKHYSTQLDSAATPSSVNPTNVVTNFNAVVTVYNQLDDDKPIVQSEFDALQTEYSEAIYKYKFHFLTIPSMFTNWLNFITFVILLIVFVTGGDNGHVTGYYVIMAISGFVFGINMVLVYAVDYRYLAFYMAGENSFPMVTSLILYFATSIFGNRRKYNSDYLVVVIDVSIAILIAFVASVLWTVAFYNYRTPMYGDMTPEWPALISPVAMVIVGMGLVYSIYPGIAPGMIVPFYLIDKIEMVLLIATAFPPVIIAILRKYKPSWSPSTNFVFPGFGGWKQYEYAPDFQKPNEKETVYAWIWHFFDVLIPLKICLAVIFIYSIHYRDSSLSRSIVNQPKMSTFLTIVFYMCHEILLAMGFPGMVANGGAGGAVLLPVQYVGALLMVFLAFYSIGYITEYKKHDPSQWPTEGMTKWNAFCYWLKMASKITNKNFKQLFTTETS